MGLDRVIESLHGVGLLFFATGFAVVFPGTVAEGRSVGGMNVSVSRVIVAMDKVVTLTP